MESGKAVQMDAIIVSINGALGDITVTIEHKRLLSVLLVKVTDVIIRY
jgi:hypothetical protein